MYVSAVHNELYSNDKNSSENHFVPFGAFGHFHLAQKLNSLVLVAPIFPSFLHVVLQCTPFLVHGFVIWHNPTRSK